MKNAIFLPPPALLRQTYRLFELSKQWLLLLFIALLAGVPVTNGQVPIGARADLHSLSPAEQQTLANHIHAWLDANPHIVDDHGLPGCFNEIHTTNNFMPWHRVHVRMLESYIAQQTGNPSYRLPKWDPGVTPTNGDKIPSFFRIRASTNIDAVPAINVNPVSTASMNTFLTDLTTCAGSSDLGAFSNAMQSYHNEGHGAVGGFFTDNRAPDCLIFWPWHAWLDDLWYVWERDCGYNGDEAYDRPITVGATEYVVNGSETWANEMFIKGIVRIPSGSEVTIAANAIIHFRSSQYEAFPTRIIVEAGGTLFVQSGARLTGIDVFGNTGGGSRYYTGWDGIVVQGNPASSDPFQQGRVQLESNSRVEHMVSGIRSENGGIIVATQANFYNNRIDVEIGPYAFDHASAFTGCNFINDQPLRYVEWSPTVCGEGEHYFGVFGASRSTVSHILLRGIKGITFQNCTIDNPFKVESDFGSKGIVSSNSNYTVTGCTIRNQVNGIRAVNKMSGPGNFITVRSSTFDRNYQGIFMIGLDFSVIESGNTFIVPDQAPTTLKPLAIYSIGSAGLIIDDNDYSSSAPTVFPVNYNYGVVIENSTNIAASVEKRDFFNGISIASQAEGDNSNLQIRCNDYNTFYCAIAVTSGTLTHQGECIFNDETAPANNTWDNSGCVGNESQIYKDPSATPFWYRAHLNQLPTCHSAGVMPFDCGTTSTSLSCANGEPPPCTGCEVQRIADLEAEKNTLPPGDGHIQFITHEQQLIYQQGVNERLESGNTGLDDAIEFTEDVEAVTALWPGNKAALLLLKSEQGTIATGTSAAIAAVPVSDPNKKWFDLRYDLLTSGRSYSQLTATEKTMVEAEAEQDTKSGAHAQAILEDAYGILATPHIEPINFERGSKPVAANAAKSSSLSIAPNPAQNNVVVSFTAPETAHQSSLEIADINGRVLRQFDLCNYFGDSQQTVPVDGFSPGIYLVRLNLNGVVAGIEKMVVTR